MNNKLQKKWNERYNNNKTESQPSRVLLDSLHLLPSRGQALDFACGTGANALCLARHGLECHAWDISDVALKALDSSAAKEKLNIQTLQRDVESNPPKPDSFDVIVVSHFLFRPGCTALSQALRKGGLLFYQTWCKEKVFQQGPQRTEFLLAPGELLSLFKMLEPVAYREEGNCGDITTGLRNQAYLVGRKR